MRLNFLAIFAFPKHWLVLLALPASISVSCGSEPEKINKEKKSLISILEPPTDNFSAQPYLFTDSKGLVYLSWITKDSLTSTLKFSTYTNENWSVPVTIASGNNWFVNWADFPIISADGNQNIVSHFLEKSENGKYTYDIKLVASSDKGRSWSAPAILHDDGKKAEHGFVSMAPYGDNYFISWLDGRNAAMEENAGHHGHHGQMTLRGAFINKSGKKLEEWELDDRVCDCCQTSAAITNTGPVVVYRDRSGNEMRDISIVRFVNNNWTEPKSIHADNWNIDGCPVNGPSIVAMDSNVAVAWFTSAGKIPKVKVAFSKNAGDVFEDPISVDNGNPIGRVDIIMLDENSAMVSWMEASEIKAVRVYNSGKKDSTITIASTSEARAAGFPQMTRSGNNVIFAWTDDKAKTIRITKLDLGSGYR